MAPIPKKAVQRSTPPPSSAQPTLEEVLEDDNFHIEPIEEEDDYTSFLETLEPAENNMDSDGGIEPIGNSLPPSEDTGDNMDSDDSSVPSWLIDDEEDTESGDDVFWKVVAEDESIEPVNFEEDLDYIQASDGPDEEELDFEEELQQPAVAPAVSKKKPAPKKKARGGKLKAPSLPQLRVPKILSKPLSMLLGFVMSLVGFTLKSLETIGKWTLSIIEHIPFIGKYVKGARVLTQRLVALAWIVLLIVGALFLFGGKGSDVLPSPGLDLPDNGHITVSNLASTGDKVLADVTNDGDTLVSELQPTVTISGSIWWQPGSWFGGTELATCTLPELTLDIEETQSVFLTCDKPVTGFNHSIQGVSE